MPRTNLMERRSYDFETLDLPVICPAGERVHESTEGPGCHCRIEGSVITAARDGTSLAIYCMGAPDLCPTWRSAREAEWKNEDPARLANPSGVQRSFTAADLDEIEERRSAGDFEGARRIADEIRERRTAQSLHDTREG